MAANLNIGGAARRTGIPVRTIRFYEAEGVLPPPARSSAGYRTFTDADLRRLRLIKNARDLGLSLAEAREFVGRAFSSECSAFGLELRALIEERRTEARARIREIKRMMAELDALEVHVAHAECVATPGERVADCGFCLSANEETSQ
jgi:DNA-binding transcriptional MerR regulator